MNSYILTEFKFTLFCSVIRVREIDVSDSALGYKMYKRKVIQEFF